MTESNQQPKKQNRVTRKKINPYLLEARARAQFNWITFAIIAVIFSFMYYRKSGDPLHGLYIILLVALIFGAYILYIYVSDKTGSLLRKDLKTQSTVAIPMELMEARGERRFGKMSMVNGFFGEIVFYRTQFSASPWIIKPLRQRRCVLFLIPEGIKRPIRNLTMLLKTMTPLLLWECVPISFSPEISEKLGIISI